MPQEAISSDPCFESNGMAENWEKYLTELGPAGRPSNHIKIYLYIRRGNQGISSIHCTISGAAENAATPVARINENTRDNNGFLPVKIKNPNENQKTN